MTKKDVPEVYTVMFLKWIADNFEIGDNITIIQKQPTSRKTVLMVSIMRHNCGRPPGAAGKKKKGM